MKATGVSRNVDELGRVVIPKELRRTLGINVKDPLAIFVHEDQIYVTSTRIRCVRYAWQNWLNNWREAEVATSN